TTDRACVSTSYLLITFLTLHTWICCCVICSIVPLLALPCAVGSALDSGSDTSWADSAAFRLLDPHPRMAVPLGHVGQDDDVALLEPATDLDRVHRVTAELYGHAVGVAEVRCDLEHADRGLGVAERRPSDEQDVGQALDLDRAVHRQVRPGAGRQLAVQCHVHAHRPVLGRRVDPHYASLDDSVSRVDPGELPDGHVLGLDFGDAQLRLETAGLDHAGELDARVDPLADLEVEPLEHALGGRDHVHRLELLAAEPDDAAQPVDLRLLCRDLLLELLAHQLQALLLHLEPDLVLVERVL